MPKKSVKAITVRSLINFVLVGALAIMVITAVGFRWVSHMIIKDKAIDISKVVIAGLTSHMKAGIMDSRDYFLSEILSLEEVRSMRVIRGPYVAAQFGYGKEQEQAQDALATSVFATGEPRFIERELAKQPYIRAIIPYVATSKGSLNCIMCHIVPENTVLGAVDIEIDLTAYRNLALKIIAAILFLSVVFIALIIINTFGTIDKYIAQPLGSLISNAREAYIHKDNLNPEAYESAEFETVAKEFNLLNTEILANQEELKLMNRQLINLNDEIEDTLRETVFTMGIIEEKRSKETRNHTLRVTKYSNLMATALELSVKDIDLITSASPLHDVGKIGIPDAILLKPGKLTAEEYEIMKNHTEIGHAMLEHSQRDILKAAAIIAQQHHEKWDGSGYPQGLKGEEIHIFGRIVAVADVFDALVSSRVYKQSWSTEDIIECFKKESGRHFDPALVEIFLTYSNKFKEIYENNK
ncbi:MAG: HD domain-containing protein [Nitrospirota bacterium]|nr:HD domain-containing protein [Nitrospirota bacterium]